MLFVSVTTLEVSATRRRLITLRSFYFSTQYRNQCSDNDSSKGSSTDSNKSSSTGRSNGSSFFNLLTDDSLQINPNECG